MKQRPSHHPSHPRAALAALFVAVQLLAACGGNDDDNNSGSPNGNGAGAPVSAPAPSPAPAEAPAAAPSAPAAPTTISPLKALDYALEQPDGSGADFSGGGAVSEPTANGATLALGAAGSVVLTVDGSGDDLTITTPDYRVVSRFAGSLLMLCDISATPGDGAARAVAVAREVAAGGIAAEAVTDATLLAGLRFFKMGHCSYQASGPQGQNSAADADTLSLAFDAAANATSPVFQREYSAAEFSAMLAEGSAIDGMRFGAWRFMVDGQAQYALVERIEADVANGVPALIQLWLPR